MWAALLRSSAKALNKPLMPSSGARLKGPELSLGTTCQEGTIWMIDRKLLLKGGIKKVTSQWLLIVSMVLLIEMLKLRVLMTSSVSLVTSSRLYQRSRQTWHLSNKLLLRKVLFRKPRIRLFRKQQSLTSKATLVLKRVQLSIHMQR